MPGNAPFTTASYPTTQLNESQNERTEFAIFSWQHTQESLDWQSAVSARNTTLTFNPDPIGDLLYNGISQYASKSDLAFGWQNDGAYTLNDMHIIRAGLYLQYDRSSSDTSSQTLAVNSVGQESSDVPLTFLNNATNTQTLAAVYLQDEWKPLSTLTINYGLRYDHYRAFSSGGQLSPRTNLVWQPTPDTTVHTGYARYFTPPPFELIAEEDVTEFVGTTAAPATTTDSPARAERSNYFDLGVQQKLSEQLVLGMDGYYKRSHHLIDEGQFGAPIIQTPFNYNEGYLAGVEFSGNYSVGKLALYGNLTFGSDKGRGIESAQFNFSPQDLAYIADHYIHLDHEQRVTASAGSSYHWGRTRLSADMLMGTGLRSDLVLANGSDIPNGGHLPTYVQINAGLSHDFLADGGHPLTLRLDLINVFDKVYEIRDGTGVGVGAPQFGPRRGLFVSATQEF